MKLPTTSTCRCVLADGRLSTITATRRPRASRADVKCELVAAPAIAAQMQQLVRLARHTEARFDSRDQVVLSMDVVPAGDDRSWELAAVLADRVVRGQYQPPSGQLFASGWSDAWQLGQLSGRPVAALAALQPHLPEAANVILGGAMPDQVPPSPAACLYLNHLGGLTGHADPGAAVSSARAWFPLHSGGLHDTLAWVEVSVAPIELLAGEEEDTIAVPGLALAQQQAVRQVLAGARHFDGRALGRWRTVLRFSHAQFQGDSYQLALVMADRLARGREFVPRGRLIASGCSSAWHAGRVDTVEGREAKIQLILKQAAPGDRVLLPSDWQEALPAAFGVAMLACGATVACIDRIGMI